MKWFCFSYLLICYHLTLGQNAPTNDSSITDTLIEYKASADSLIENESQPLKDTLSEDKVKKLKAIIPEVVQNESSREQSNPSKLTEKPTEVPLENDSSEKSEIALDSSELAQPILEESESLISPPITDIFSWGKIFWAIIILILAHYIIKLIAAILERFAERSVKHRMTFKSLGPMVRILGWAVALFIVVHGVFNPPIETLVAVTASVGIAVGFAAQDILKNIFGGIMILFDRPFQVGDKIQVGEHYGEVIEIGLRSTRIVTKDDSTVSIPNAEVVNNAVSNSNAGESNCQVVAELYLPIEIDTNRARQLAIEAAQVSQYIYLNKPITVLFVNEIKERKPYLKMRLKAYVSDIRYEFAFQSDMTEIVMKEFLAEGIIKIEA